MPPSCLHCASQRVLNLETARKLGVASSALIGTLHGAYVSLYSPERLTLSSAAHFPLSRMAGAVIAGASGGMAGATYGNQMALHLFPPGEGSPWLCLSCGHAFRVLD